LEQKKAQEEKKDKLPETAVTEEKTSTDAKQQVKEKVFTGYASYYNLPGKTTASGEKFDASAMTGAMTAEKVPTLPKDVKVEYTKTDKNGKATTVSISVKVNDRGPFAVDSKGKAIKPLKPHPTRVIDLSPAAFKALAGSLEVGVIQVTVRVPQ